MRLDKIKNTFNDYKVELSWGQLEAVRSALEADHSDPLKDEMLAELQWYMDRVPGPGEEEEDQKQREAGQVVPTEGGEEGDYPVPMPPTDGMAQTGGEPQEPPAEMPGGEPGAEGGMPDEGGMPPEGMGDMGGEAPEGDLGAEAPLPPESEVDRQLPEPPAE